MLAKIVHNLVYFVGCPSSYHTFTKYELNDDNDDGCSWKPLVVPLLFLLLVFVFIVRCIQNLSHAIGVC